jgi:hypothetical protein
MKSEQYIYNINAASTCFGAILRELKVPDEICLRYIMGAEASESGC